MAQIDPRPTSVDPVNLFGLSRSELSEFLASIGEKPFRAKQLFKWIYQLDELDFDAMTDLSKALRAKLQAVAHISLPDIVLHKIASDGTQKWIMKMADGAMVETVMIPEGDRRTLCVSSQVGCVLDCSFCSTGKQGFQRDLDRSEIIGQMWLAAHALKSQKVNGKPITNVVMMGMGEPLLNYDNVISALNIMKDDMGYGVSRRRLTVSTSGVVPMIDQLSNDIDVSLALSLHAPNDELRDELVPLNKKYNLDEVLAACKRYVDKHESISHRSIVIEYVLLKGVNDQPEHAQQLVTRLKDLRCKINLIPFNPFPHSGYQTPSGIHVRKFQDRLIKAGFTTTVRTTRGDDIDAACGQLVGDVKDKTKRNARWTERIKTQQIDTSE